MYKILNSLWVLLSKSLSPKQLMLKQIREINNIIKNGHLNQNFYLFLALLSKILAETTDAI